MTYWLLLAIVVVVALIFNAFFVTPIAIIHWFHLPSWTFWGTAILFLSWCVKD